MVTTEVLALVSVAGGAAAVARRRPPFGFSVICARLARKEASRVARKRKSVRLHVEVRLALIIHHETWICGCCVVRSGLLVVARKVAATRGANKKVIGRDCLLLPFSCLYESAREFRNRTKMPNSERRLVSRRQAIVALLLLSAVLPGADAWLPASTTTTTNVFSVARKFSPRTVQTTVLFSDVSAVGTSTTLQESDSEEDEDEFEYVEYDALGETEFVGSEWLVGTNWDSRRDKIDETWVRLVVDEKGKNVCYWGDKSQGKWALDVSTQFLSVSKESFFGKQIWAGVVEDYYFQQGTVRGWNYLASASVVGQWQGKRLGVDPEEAGVAPWFEETDEEEAAIEPADEKEDDSS